MTNRAVLMLTMIWAAVLLMPSAALSAAPAEFTQIPLDGTPGAGAEQLDNPRDVAANPDTGHVYISESSNLRISEFTAWGEFVKAWGWDVAPGAVDEEQEVRVRAASGQFRLSFEGDETGDLDFDATAAEVEAALEALTAINTGGGGVEVSGGAGEGLRVYVVRFDAGPLAGANVEQLAAADGSVPLGGGDPTSEATVATRANGTPGGTGLESCTTASGCQAGVAGNGAGQLAGPRGVAVDLSGNVYVFDNPLSGESKRLQKFSPAGEFLWMVGGGVNQGGGTPANPGNICTAQDLANGDTCGAAAPGTGPREFSNNTVRNFITYSPTADAILIGDKDRIQEIEPDGSFGGQISFDAPGPLEALDEKTVVGIAADSDGEIYLALSGSDGIFKLSAAGLPAGTPYPLAVTAPIALEVDAADSVCAISGNGTPGGKEVVCFDSSGAPIEGMEAGDGFGTHSSGAINALTGLGANQCAGSAAPGNLYVSAFLTGTTSHVKAYGSTPIGCEPPPLRPPTISDQFAFAVGIDAATVRARINPRFWDDTTYYVEYGTGKCSEGGCLQQVPLPPGKQLTTQVTSAALTASAFLGDLDPGTTYHFRFVAQSSGGGPVFGIDPDGEGPGLPSEAEGLEGAFTTFGAPSIGPCPNDAFRSGPSADLPDCRAYEMVSPTEKGSTDVLTPEISAFNRASLGAERFTYSSSTAFGEAEGAPAIAQYMAERRESDRSVSAGDTGDGWQSELIASPRSRKIPGVNLLQLFKNEYKAFTPDLCKSWVRPLFEPRLTEDAVPSYINLYSRDHCGAGEGSYEAVTIEAPPHATSGINVGLEVQGTAADGSKEVLVSQDSFDGAPAPFCPGTSQCLLRLYQHLGGGELDFLCILPNGNPIANSQACYAGTAREAVGDGVLGSFQNAVSGDGERVFWSAGSASAGGDGTGGGRIYVRVGGSETFHVSKAAEDDSGTSKSVFWGAAEDGSRAVFTTGDGLFSFDVEAGMIGDPGATELIAEDVGEVFGVSEDARRAYFVSEEAIAGSGQNSEGDEAVAGEPNVYFWEEGSGTSFVATLTEEDETPNQAARVTGDGLHLLFASLAPLTGYDNTDAVENRAALEVFLYDAAAAELRCVSCNPTGARPRGRELRDANTIPADVWVAAQIPWRTRALFPSRPLTEDGRRVFFESHGKLAPGDNNNLRDVYQWEEAGKGTCTTAAPSFSAEAGGCIDLISGGESAREAKFVDATPSGNDVFISTLSGLVPPDFGLLDIYDARVEGGFTYPTPDPPCEGGACQSPPPPPPLITPASSTQGPGNLNEKKPCRKGQRKVRRKGKTKCVKKKQAKGKRKNRGSKQTGRAAR